VRVRVGRRRISPLQFGQMHFIWVAQASQNVHSKEQM
jgi:hypothetical protein